MGKTLRKQLSRDHSQPDIQVPRSSVWLHRRDQDNVHEERGLMKRGAFIGHTKCWGYYTADKCKEQVAQKYGMRYAKYGEDCGCGSYISRICNMNGYREPSKISYGWNGKIAIQRIPPDEDWFRKASRFVTNTCEWCEDRFRVSSHRSRTQFCPKDECQEAMITLVAGVKESSTSKRKPGQAPPKGLKHDRRARKTICGKKSGYSGCGKSFMRVYRGSRMCSECSPESGNGAPIASEAIKITSGDRVSIPGKTVVIQTNPDTELYRERAMATVDQYMQFWSEKQALLLQAMEKEIAMQRTLLRFRLEQGINDRSHGKESVLGVSGIDIEACATSGTGAILFPKVRGEVPVQES